MSVCVLDLIIIFNTVTLNVYTFKAMFLLEFRKEYKLYQVIYIYLDMNMYCIQKAQYQYPNAMTQASKQSCWTL